MPDDIRRDGQIRHDRENAQRDRQRTVDYVRTNEYVRGQNAHLRAVEGPPKVSIEDRLFTELTRAAEFAEADVDVASFVLRAEVTLADGSTLDVEVPA